MQQKKRPPVIKHCPHHGKVPLKKRRGRVSKQWLLYCPLAQCGYTEQTTKGASV
jgi:hypothetical protein